MSSGRKLIPAVLCVYVMIVALYTIYSFDRAKRDAVRQLYSTLYASASSLGILLGDDFYDIYTPQNPLPPEQDSLLQERLNHLAASLDVEYVYSFVKLHGVIYYTMSSSVGYVNARPGSKLFFMRFPKPSDELIAAFATGQSKYLFFPSPLNKWDSFYSLYLPRTTPGGIQYALAADIKLEHQKRLLGSCFREALILALVLMAPILLVFWILHVMARQRENDLQAQLYFDLLTGLPNASGLMRDFSGHRERPVSVVAFNVDSFRNVNSRFGMKTGDETLVRIADEISGACGSSEKLYKLPADEFLVDMTGHSLDDIIAFAQKVLSDLSGVNIRAADHEFCFTARAGIVFEQRSNNAIPFAVMAVRAARESHREYFVYCDEINTELQSTKNFFWLGKLRDALAEDRIVPFFQPICDNATGKPVMYESLVRMIDTDGSVIPPARFLDVARQSSLYRDLTRTMIKKSLECFSQIDVPVALNFTGRDIDDEETVSFLFDTVVACSMRNRVVIELVESESMTQNLHLEGFLGRAAQNGIRISLDDFGSGYSNFEYISRIKADFLKIDGVIVRDFPAKKESSALITAIASFAGQLGISVIAEYVSDERAYSCLRSLGIGYSQGFYFGKPVRFADITGSTGTECVSLGDVRECPAHS